MTDIDRAAEIIALATRGALTADGHPMKMSDLTAQVIAESLADDGLLAPEPQIIRTVDELEALDPDTLVAIPRDYGDCDQPRLAGWVRTFYPLGESSPVFPAVVVATGAQVRAARAALQEATE